MRDGGDSLLRRRPGDARSDVYSLGATLYEALTLRPPFPGEDPHRVLERLATEDVSVPRRWNRGVPPDLETIVLEALTKEPERRYASAAESAEDPRRFLGHEPIRTRRATMLSRAEKWASRHRALVALGAIALLLASGTLVCRTATVDESPPSVRLNGLPPGVPVTGTLVLVGDVDGDCKADILTACPTQPGLATGTLRQFSHSP